MTAKQFLSCLFFRCHVKPGETVLVHGASGAVGISVVPCLLLYVYVLQLSTHTCTCLFFFVRLLHLTLM